MRSPNHMAPARPAPTRHLLVEIALGLAVIVLAALLLFRPGAAEPAPENSSPRAEESAPSPASASAEKSAPESLVIRLHGMEETTELRFAPGELFVPPEAPLEGYTFLRWQNASGEAVPAAGIPVWEEADYYPVYAMKLGREDHAPYLSLDENGAFRPSGTLTRRETVSALYFLLDTKLVGDGSFLDVPEEDALYPAAATLKQLGILSGSRLHPDETVTRQEFLDMLCRFFPQGSLEAEFSDLSGQDAAYPLFCTAAERGWIESGPGIAARPDEELTRLEFVSILSAAMDRHGDREHRLRLVGTILDLRHDDPHFWDVAEAVIPHHGSGEGARERWSRSEALPTRQEGLFFLGTELHAIDAEGNPVVNGEYAGLRFDGDGIETSGDAELDQKIRELLPTLVDPSAMRGEEMLRVLFDYTVRKFRYRPGNYYPLGEPSGWEAGEALSMLTDGRGNCYSFAALYYELARAVGYDAVAYTGTVFGGREDELETYKDIHGDTVELPYNRCPHGWVEIEFDGGSYIFDPEYAYRIHGKGYWDYGFFKLGENERLRFGYLTSLEGLTSAPAAAAP